MQSICDYYIQRLKLRATVLSAVSQQTSLRLEESHLDT